MKILPVTLGVALLVLGSFAWVNWKPRREAIPVQSLNTWQEADSPTGFPVNSGEGLRIPPLDFQMDLFRGSQRYRIPLAVRFDMPMGAANGALTYNAQSFWEMNERRGGRHTGDDLNGIGGMDTEIQFLRLLMGSWFMRESRVRVGVRFSF